MDSFASNIGDFDMNSKYALFDTFEDTFGDFSSVTYDTIADMGPMFNDMELDFIDDIPGDKMYQVCL